MQDTSQTSPGPVNVYSINGSVFCYNNGYGNVGCYNVGNNNVGDHNVGDFNNGSHNNGTGNLVSASCLASAAMVVMLCVLMYLRRSSVADLLALLQGNFNQGMNNSGDYNRGQDLGLKFVHMSAGKPSV